jgi:hypothetical protein
MKADRRDDASATWCLRASSASASPVMGWRRRGDAASFSATQQVGVERGPSFRYSSSLPA